MENNSFDEKYAKYYDLFNEGKDYEKECDFLEEIFKKFGGEVKTILNLGCGTGMHDLELSKRGYEMTGLDLSEEMIKIAKKRCPEINFIVGDMSNFNIDKKFDAVICMFSSLGYLIEDKQIEDFLKSVKKHLNKNGLLIIDCWNGLGVLHELPSSREKIVELNGLKIIRKSFPNLDIKQNIIDVRFNIKVLKDESLIKEYEEMNKVRFFFPKELERYMNNEGFELIYLCPLYNLDKRLTEKDWNMMLVAKK